MDSDISPPSRHEVPGKIGSSLDCTDANIPDIPQKKRSLRYSLRFPLCCLLLFSNGFHDASPGALIPYIQAHYNISYLLVSLVFLSLGGGFVIAVTVAERLDGWVGRRWVLVGASLCLGVGALVVGILGEVDGPWAVVVVTFLLFGLAQSLVLAQVNAYCGGLENNTAMGYVHGSYGIGATISPLLATFLISKGLLWWRYYFIILAVFISNSIFSFFIFRDGSPSLHTINSETPTIVETKPKMKQNTNELALPTATIKGNSSNLHTILSPATLATSLFIFSYQGAEVSNGGWVPTFLIEARSGDPKKMGYVATGFWCGLTLGRFTFPHIFSYLHRLRPGSQKKAHDASGHTATYVIISLCLLLEIFTWQIPSVIVNAMLVGIFGWLLGPMYPSAMLVLLGKVDPEHHVSVLSVVSAIGSAGGGLAPFTTGVLATKFGAWVLYPVSLGLLVVMEVAWWVLVREK